MTPGLEINDALVGWLSNKVFDKCYENIADREIDSILIQVLEDNSHGDKCL